MSETNQNPQPSTLELLAAISAHSDGKLVVNLDALEYNEIANVRRDTFLAQQTHHNNSGDAAAAHLNEYDLPVLEGFDALAEANPSKACNAIEWLLAGSDDAVGRAAAGDFAWTLAQKAHRAEDEETRTHALDMLHRLVSDPDQVVRDEAYRRIDWDLTMASNGIDADKEFEMDGLTFEEGIVLLKDYVKTLKSAATPSIGTAVVAEATAPPSLPLD